MTGVSSGCKKILLMLCVTDAFFLLIFIGFGQMFLPHGVFTEGIVFCDGRICTAQEKTFSGNVFKTFSFEQEKAENVFVEEGGRGYRLWIGKDHIFSCADCALWNRASFPFLWYRRISAEKLKDRMISGNGFVYSQYSPQLRWLGYVLAGTFIVVGVLYKAGAIKG
ncbi:MAG: hypothetical protein IKR09_09735 [Alphaproteobacteria bacterium]|nr:hypothetical protein [Alphaproteobacteria bacterium]